MRAASRPGAPPITRPDPNRTAAPNAGIARPLIRFEGVSKHFGGLAAVDDLTLDINDGEVFCLLGPSGCGKSTLLRLLAGLEVPDSGRILLDGRDLFGTPPHRRPLNMMFQSYALFPHMNVAGNIGYGLKRAGLPRTEIAARTDEMLRLVQLDGLGTRYPAQLSGGQRQRAALARALARRPRVLLLDEPLGALDRRLRESTQAELKDLQVRLGTTFVVVTHDQAEAMAIADRIGVMERGRIVQAGGPREVYERPASRFVAEFLGHANLIEGRILATDGTGCQIGTPLAQTPLALPVGSCSAGQGARVTVAIRPERIMLEPEGVLLGPNAFPGEIVDVAFLGPLTSYRVRHGSGAIFHVMAAAVSGAPLQRGQAVVVSFASDAAVVLAG
jgi:putrescine transport system ATP-binding protein